MISSKVVAEGVVGVVVEFFVVVDIVVVLVVVVVVVVVGEVVVVDSPSTSLPRLTGCSVLISVVVKSSSKAMEVAVAAGVVFEVKVVVVVVDGEVVKSSSKAMEVAVTVTGASSSVSKVVSSSCL